MAPRRAAATRIPVSPQMLFGVAFAGLAALEVVGNTTALISLNFWLRAFQYGSATVTVNFLSAIFYVVLILPFTIAACVTYVRRHRKGPRVALRRLAVLLRPKHVVNGLMIAMADAWIDIASTYAAGRTTVLTQVFAKSLEPLTTFTLSYLVQGRGEAGDTATTHERPATARRMSQEEGRDTSDAASSETIIDSSSSSSNLKRLKERLPPWMPTIGFLLSITAVLLHLWQKIESRKSNDDATFFFIALYCTGVMSSSVYAVTQSRFLRIATADMEHAIEEAAEVEASIISEGGGGANAALLMDGTDDKNEDDDEEEPIPTHVIRAAALTYDLVFALIITLVVVPPLDTIRGFGSSHSVSDVWTNLHDGLHCVVSCENNLAYALLANGGWTLVYFADTFLNHFSPALNSMMGEFTSPLGVLILFAHPAWNLSSHPDTDAKHLLLNALSVLFLVVGVSMFARYEFKTSKHSRAVIGKAYAAALLVEANAPPASVQREETAPTSNHGDEWNKGLESEREPHSLSTICDTTTSI